MSYLDADHTLAGGCYVDVLHKNTMDHVSSKVETQRDHAPVSWDTETRQLREWGEGHGEDVDRWVCEVRSLAGCLKN